MKSFEDYGPEYEQLLLRANDGLKSARDYAVQFATIQIADSIQARFRAYVRALKQSPSRPDLVALASNLSTRTASAALVFYRREDSVDAIAIREALGLERGFADTSGSGVIAPQSGQTDALGRLHQLRARKNESK
jgi:hypothetical protein